MYHEDIIEIELNNGTVFRSFANKTIGEGDAQANRFGVIVNRNGEGVNLSGCVCTGYFIRPTGDTVVITGVASGSKAYVDLPQACYAVEGQFSLAIKVSGNNITGTMRIVDGVVSNTTTETLVDPGVIIPSVEDLISAIEDAVESLPADYENLWTTLAPSFDSGATYEPGDYVTYNGGYYVFTSAHSGTWDDGDVEEANIGSQLGKVDKTVSETSEATVNLNTPPSGRYRIGSSSGDIIVTESGNYWGMEKRIPCKSSTNYILCAWDTGATTNVHVYVAWYTSAGAFIQIDDNNREAKNPVNWPVTSPQNAKMMAVYVYNSNGISDRTLIDIREGAVAPAYYMKPTTSVDNAVRLHLSTRPHDLLTVKSPTANLCTVGFGRYRVGIAGTIFETDSNYCGMSDMIPAKAGTTYICCAWYSGVETNSTIFIAWYDHGRRFISSSSANRSVNRPVRFPAEAPENTAFMAFHIYNSNGVSEKTLLDIREGSDAPGYYMPPLLDMPTSSNEKFAFGLNPYRKSVDHGGFCDLLNGEEQYQNSPKAFLRAAKEGIVYHNLDVVFSADNVPFTLHNDQWTDINGVTFKVSETSAENVKTHYIGDSNYSWIPQTLAETNEYIRNIGGIIDMVDLSYPTVARASLLPTYYRSHNIHPTWTNVDTTECMNAFISAGSEFGVYIVCGDATALTNALSYISSHTDTKFAINASASSASQRETLAGYVAQFATLGVKIYVNTFISTTFRNAPAWADGIISRDINVNYELWKETLLSNGER